MNRIRKFLANRGQNTWLITGGVALVLLLVVGGVFLRRQNQRQQVRSRYETVRVERGDLVSIIGATGTVRARQEAVLVWKTSGKVESVHAGLGTNVSAGDILAVLEQKSLPQNIISSQAELVNAKQALEDARDSGLQYARALQAAEKAEQALEDARNPVLIQAQAEKDVADARKALDDAQRQLYYAENPADQNTINKAEAELILAEDRLEDAREAFDKVKHKSKDNTERALAQKELSEAQRAYNQAVWNLQALKGTSNEIDQAVARANVAMAEAQLQKAEEEWERVKDGLSPGTIALREAEYADAQRELQDVQEGGGTDPDAIAVAEARVAAAQSALELARITAPFDGRITQVEVLEQDIVSQGEVAFRIDDMSRMFAEIQVSEVDINKVEVGQEVTLTFDAILAEEYHGTVTAVAQAGNSVQGVVNFKVTVAMSDADRNVLPGMTTAANIVVSELENVLLVPNRAVRVREGRRVVYVLRGNQAQAVDIELGASSETESEVLSGDLRAGDEIILNPPADFESQGGPPPFVGDD